MRRICRPVVTSNDPNIVYAERVVDALRVPQEDRGVKRPPS